jgi:hypothetical protein
MEDYKQKTPLQSKKFLAYFFANVFSKVYLFYATSKNEGDMVIIMTIFCSTFLDVGYLLGQASLDKYTRMTEVAIKHGINVKT